MRVPILLASLVLTAAAQNRRVVAIVHDPSQSQREWTAPTAADQQRLIAALPDRTRVLVFTAGLHVRRIFEGDLNPLRRSEVLRQLQSVPLTEPNTDLGAALTGALRALAASDGEKTIVFFSDAQNRPAPGSPYRGRSFESILNSIALPPDTRIVVRVYGAEPLKLNRPQIAVVRDVPDWAALLDLAPKKPPMPAPEPPGWKKWRFWIAFAIICVVAVCVLVWRKLARADRGRYDLLDGVELPLDAPVPVERHTVTRYRIQAGGASIDLEPGVRQCAVIGDTPIADLPLDSAEGAWVCVKLRGEPELATLTFENVGDAPVYVGSRRVPQRASIELPSQYLEARLGRELLQIYPETVVLQTEPRTSVSGANSGEQS